MNPRCGRVIFAPASTPESPLEHHSGCVLTVDFAHGFCSRTALLAATVAAVRIGWA